MWCCDSPLLVSLPGLTHRLSALLSALWCSPSITPCAGGRRWWPRFPRPLNSCWQPSRVKLKGRLMRVLVGMAMTWYVLSQEYIGRLLSLLYWHSIHKTQQQCTDIILLFGSMCVYNVHETQVINKMITVIQSSATQHAAITLTKHSFPVHCNLSTAIDTITMNSLKQGDCYACVWMSNVTFVTSSSLSPSLQEWQEAKHRGLKINL